MAESTVSCRFDKDATWRKVCDRKAVFLDMNCWINMADEKTVLATQVRERLRKLVSNGVLFCPLVYGVLLELNKQARDSRLRVGALMEALSVNVSYANKFEIFAWEVRQFASRTLGIGPYELGKSGLYVPVAGYASSDMKIGYPQEFGSAETDKAVRGLQQAIESLTVTQMLEMEDDEEVAEYVKGLPDPQLLMSEAISKVRSSGKGNKRTIRVLQFQAVLDQVVWPNLRKVSVEAVTNFGKCLMEGMNPPSREKVERRFEAVFANLPSLYNQAELCVAISQNPSQKFEINDFFDYENMPIPLAYASVFVAQDKGIRDVLRNRTKILGRTSCRYCFDLAELEDWLRTEGLI
jgi:hypothetical protein